MKRIVILLLALSFFVLYGKNSAAQDKKEGGLRMKITSPSFKDGGNIPVKFTGQGEDISPALDIENLPEGTKSLALIVDDPDAPMKTWVHWVVYDIAPLKHINENSVPGTEGINDFGRLSYGGPNPPSGTHRYFFKLYALDKTLGLKEGASKAEVEKAMKGCTLDKAEMIGLYKRTAR